MHYLIALQLFCGCFCVYLAARSGHSRVFWGLVGALVPVLGVAACLWETRVPAQTSRSPGTGRAPRRSRPKRCCGRYMPECWGCPYFRRHLFSREAEGSKGHCAFFDRDLMVGGRSDGAAAADDEA